MKEKRTRNIAMLFRVTAREQELIIQKMEQLGMEPIGLFQPSPMLKVWNYIPII